MTKKRDGEGREAKTELRKAHQLMDKYVMRAAGDNGRSKNGNIKLVNIAYIHGGKIPPSVAPIDFEYPFRHSARGCDTYSKTDLVLHQEMKDIENV